MKLEQLVAALKKRDVGISIKVHNADIEIDVTQNTDPWRAIRLVAEGWSQPDNMGNALAQALDVALERFDHTWPANEAPTVPSRGRK